MVVERLRVVEAHVLVGEYLSKQQAQQCQTWIDNDRRLRELLVRLEAIGIQRLEAEQRHD